MSESRKTLRKAFHRLRNLLSGETHSPERLSSVIVRHMCEGHLGCSDMELRAYHLARRQGLNMQEATHAALLCTQLESLSLSELLSRLQEEKPTRCYSPGSGLQKRHKAAGNMRNA